MPCMPCNYRAGLMKEKDEFVVDRSTLWNNISNISYSCIARWKKFISRHFRFFCVDNREFVAKASTDKLEEYEDEAAQYALSALHILSGIQSQPSNTPSECSPPVTHLGTVERPKFCICREQLEFLVENHFTVPQMSQLIHRAYVADIRHVEK